MSELDRYPYCGHSALLGHFPREWQDTSYILATFAKTLKKASNEYLDFVKAGVSQGRKPELIGGGLIRSLGGWKEGKKYGVNRHDRIKSDERILGDSGFVVEVLGSADERYERRYMLKSLGYDISRVERKVIALFDIEKKDLYWLCH